MHPADTQTEPQKGMHPADIQAELKKRGLTQKALAEKLGVSEFPVSAVINKKHVSDRIMTAVAEAIGRDKTEVFAEYYLSPPKRSTSHAIGDCEETIPAAA